MAMSMPPPGPNTPLGPPPPGMVSDFNNPQDHERYTAAVVTLAVLFGFSTLCVLLRTWTRAMIVKLFGWDDAFAFLAMLLNIGFTICIMGEVHTGLTEYDWNVRFIDFMEHNEATYNYWNAVDSIIYYFLYAFIKISILSFYLRVLASTRRKLRWAIWFVIFAVVCVTIGCTADLLTFCKPIVKLFNATVPGTCDGFNANLFFAQALLSAITDMFILVPPIPIIWRLSTTPKRKFGLILILCLGFFVTGIATARAVLLSPNYNHAVYELYDNFNGAYWGILEVNFAIAVICLPALAQLFFKSRATYRQNDNSPRNGRRGEVEEVEVGEAPQQGSGQSPRNAKNKKPSSVSRIVNGLYPASILSQTRENKHQSVVRTAQTGGSLSSVAEKSSDESDVVPSPPGGSTSHHV